MYGWNEKWDAMVTNDNGQDQLQSCKNREIFAIDTYSLFGEWSSVNLCIFVFVKIASLCVITKDMY